MDTPYSLEIDPELGKLFSPTDEDSFFLGFSPPVTSEYQVHIGSPSGAEGIADVSNPTNASGPLEPRRRRTNNPPAPELPIYASGALVEGKSEESERSTASYWSESTVCPPQGHLLWPLGPPPKLEQSDPSRSAFEPASESPQDSTAWRRRASKSRNHSKDANGDGDEGLASEGGCGGQELHPKGPWLEPQLKCLFYLENPVKHQQCANCHFREWAALRQHLFRKHRQPAKSARADYNRDTESSEAIFEAPSGITEDQEHAIRNLTQRGRKFAIEDVWRAGWKILFPASPHSWSTRSISRHRQYDLKDLTEADTRLLASGEFQLWIQNLPGMADVGEEQRADICRDFIQTSKARWLGQDTPLSQVPRQEVVEDHDATLNFAATTQGEPSDFLQYYELAQEFELAQELEFPQEFESLEVESGDIPPTLSIGSPPDVDMESPLYASIRRVLSPDGLYAAEDLISAIKKRSEGKIVASGSGPASFDNLELEAPAGQESTSGGGKKRPTTASGQCNSSSNKKQKTSSPDADEGDEDGGGNGGDGGGSDGGGGGGTPPDHIPDESFDGWICPYCLKYVEITCIKDFQACGRPGFRNRDDLRTHLTRLHSYEAKSRLRNLEKGLGRYYMTAQQWEDVKAVMDNIERPRRKKDPQKWLEIQKAWYLKVWRILFPGSQYVPDSPFHLRNEALKERCHQVLEALMDLEWERAQGQDYSSRGATPLFTKDQVRKMLGKALHIGLDSLPSAAQHFGKRGAVETTTEPQTGHAATTSRDEAAGLSPDGSEAATTSTCTASAETNGSSTPENALPMIPKTAATPQPSPVPIALQDTGQTFLQQTSDVLLMNNGNVPWVAVWFTPKDPLQAIDQAPVARVQVTAPSTFSVKIEEVSEWDPSGLIS